MKTTKGYKKSHHEPDCAFRKEKEDRINWWNIVFNILIFIVLASLHIAMVLYITSQSR